MPSKHARKRVNSVSLMEASVSWHSLDESAATHSITTSPSYTNERTVGRSVGPT